MTPHTTVARRLPPDDRRTNLLTVAMDIARNQGIAAVTRKSVALAANVSPGLVTFRFLSVTLLREAVLQAAIEQGDARIVAAGIVASEPIALAAPEWLKRAAAETLL